MIWTYSGLWFDEFLTLDPDRDLAALKFLIAHGMRGTDIFPIELEVMDEAKREHLFAFLAEHDLCYTLRPTVPELWTPETSADDRRRAVDAEVARIGAFAKDCRSPVVAFVSHGLHRFDREVPLEIQMERLRDALTPMAEVAAANDKLFGIENHGDYYCVELVELCKQVPHLGIFLDTGNCFLIGEAPLPAFQLAAPHVVGCHIKEHRVRPNSQALSFELEGAVLGQGDCELKACYELLLAEAPDPENLLMAIEWIPVPGMTPLDSLKASFAWVHELRSSV